MEKVTASLNQILFLEQNCAHQEEKVNQNEKKVYDSVVAKRCGCFAAGLRQIVPKTT